MKKYKNVFQQVEIYTLFHKHEVSGRGDWMENDLLYKCG